MIPTRQCMRLTHVYRTVLQNHWHQLKQVCHVLQFVPCFIASISEKQTFPVRSIPHRIPVTPCPLTSGPFFPSCCCWAVGWEGHWHLQKGMNGSPCEGAVQHVSWALFTQTIKPVYSVFYAVDVCWHFANMCWVINRTKSRPSEYAYNETDAHEPWFSRTDDNVDTAVLNMN